MLIHLNDHCPYFSEEFPGELVVSLSCLDPKTEPALVSYPEGLVLIPFKREEETGSEDDPTYFREWYRLQKLPDLLIAISFFEDGLLEGSDNISFTGYLLNVELDSYPVGPLLRIISRFSLDIADSAVYDPLAEALGQAIDDSEGDLPLGVEVRWPD